MTATLFRAATRADLAEVRARMAPGAEVALVPTMGALHAGHRSLIEQARAAVGPEGVVVVSIFVNPLQFAPGEDLDRYPRTPEADLDLCAQAGAEVVFMPEPSQMYPEGDPIVTVDPGPLAAKWEGEVRPTHFRGVLTVVAKLFGLVRPDLAFFGEKDFQQLALIRRMVEDLCMGVRIVGVPTVREPDGLALSSRNRYLDPEQRVQATVLSQTLMAAREAAGEGKDAAIAAARAVLRQGHGVDLDYLDIAGPNLGPAPEHGPARMLIAARVGSTRLIDNLALDLGPASDATDREDS